MFIKTFKDRTDAGRFLASKLKQFTNRADVIVLGLPRGGVPVAYEVAHKLNAPLDILVVRKLGVPGHEELAMGGQRLIDAAANQRNLRRTRQVRITRPPLASSESVIGRRR